MSEKGNNGADQNAPKGGAEIPAAEQSQNDLGSGVKADKPDGSRVMGLERYLQKFPQKGGITTLLRLKHKADVKTKPEWDALVKEFLQKKVQ